MNLILQLLTTMTRSQEECLTAGRQLFQLFHFRMAHCCAIYFFRLAFTFTGAAPTRRRSRCTFDAFRAACPRHGLRINMDKCIAAATERWADEARRSFPEFAFHGELEIPGSPCGPLRLLTTRPGLECVVGLGGGSLGDVRSRTPWSSTM